MAEKSTTQFEIEKSMPEFPNLNPKRKPRYVSGNAQPCFVTMRDGVRLAVDLSLPANLPAGQKSPALLALTRYWRAQALKPPFSWFMKLPDNAGRFFTGCGYAVLRVDMRGTGASFGVNQHPWPAIYLQDMYELVSWVVSQPWSDGQVGGFGNSYQGTTAELLGACGHPAVKGSFVRFNEYDVYPDISFPGGIPNAFILKKWAAYNRDLDANRVPSSLSPLEKLLIKGVKPVDPAELPAAVREHSANGEVDSALENVTFRDDLDPDLGIRLDEVSMHTRPTTIPLDVWGGWFDAATADGVIRRFVNSTQPMRAVIGPWNHGATQHVGAAKNPFPFPLQIHTMLDFFELVFAGKPVGRNLYYYTTGEECWKVTQTWPPAGSHASRLYLNAGQKLADRPDPGEGVLKFQADFSATSGLSNRWQTELDQRPVRYDLQPKLSFVSQPIETEMELTGYPQVTLYISSSHTDGAFFVYLESLLEDGKAVYLTEGQLRALHRKVSDNPPYRQFTPYHSFRRTDSQPLPPGEEIELQIGLQPISVLLPAGSRLRLSLACADKDTFAPIGLQPGQQDSPVSGGINLGLSLGKSWIELPEIER